MKVPHATAMILPDSGKDLSAPPDLSVCVFWQPPAGWWYTCIVPSRACYFLTTAKNVVCKLDVGVRETFAIFTILQIIPNSNASYVYSCINSYAIQLLDINAHLYISFIRLHYFSAVLCIFCTAWVILFLYNYYKAQTNTELYDELLLGR
jgi:hypothetical protein